MSTPFGRALDKIGILCETDDRRWVWCYGTRWFSQKIRLIEWSFPLLFLPTMLKAMY